MNILSKYKSFIISVSIFLAVMAIILVFVLNSNDGMLVFTLDDAYIHMGLAENIIRGHYGVNQNEFLTPASSILWPFLLAPFMLIENGTTMVFLINILLSIILIFIYFRIVQKILIFEKNRTLYEVLILVFIMVLSNFPYLIFTGMEHVLQILSVVLVVWGLIKENEENKISKLLIISILLTPLVRFENAAVAVAAIIYLFAKRHKKAYKVIIFFILGLIVILGLGGIISKSLNIQILPSSVLAKSIVLSNHGNLHTIINNFVFNLACPRSRPLLFFLLTFLSFMIFSPKKRNLASFFAIVILLHLAAGKLSGVERYDPYLFTLSGIGLIFLLKDSIKLFSSRVQLTSATLFMVLLTFTVGYDFIKCNLDITTMSNEIYSQQYQMHRIVKKMDEPVAINDLGYVTYRNDNYVLDLFGLASHEALELRLTEKNNDWMDDLCKKHNVHLIMIYNSWFGSKMPSNWIEIGHLLYPKKTIACASNDVAFYVTDLNSYNRVCNVIRSIEETFPKNTSFVFKKYPKTAEKLDDYQH